MFKSNKILRTSTGTPRSTLVKSNKILLTSTIAGSYCSSPWAEKNSQAQSHAQAQDAGARTSTQ